MKKQKIRFGQIGFTNQFLEIYMKKKPKSQPTKVGMYPHTNVILSVTTALFITGLFALFIIHADELKALIRSNIQIHVYLKQNLDVHTRKNIEEKLSNLKFIAHKDGKPYLQFISKEESAKRMIQETGEDFVDFLGENPLRDAYLIRIKEKYLEQSKLKIIRTRIEAIEGVFEVDYPEVKIDQINLNINKIGAVIAIFMVILLITVVVLIANAIKLAMYSQRFLIRSMQLVGATDKFIKRPFLKRAAVHGFMGGFLACSLLLLVLSFFNLQLQELAMLQDLTRMFILFFLLVFIGIIVCLTSVYVAVSRYLEMSLDDLYK